MSAGAFGRAPRPVFWLLVVALATLDQLTKGWAQAALAPDSGADGVFHRTVVVIPGFFNLAFAANTGIAFSLLRGGNGGVLVATGAALVLAAVAIWRFRLLDWAPLSTNVVAALIVAGACGNLIDRALRGYVVDFLDFYWGAWHYPTFNVADSCIVVAVGWMVWRSLRPRRA